MSLAGNSRCCRNKSKTWIQKLWQRDSMIHLDKGMIDELGFKKNVKRKETDTKKKGQGGEIISVNKCKDFMTASECLKNELLGARKVHFVSSHCRWCIYLLEMMDWPTMAILMTLYKWLRDTEETDRDVASSQRRKRRLKSLESPGKVQFWEVPVMVESESSS